MTSKAELITWHDACQAFEREDYDTALELFDQIADSAKIHFNIGVVLAAVQEHESAVEAYLDALKADQFFAVGYFQKGVSNFLLGEFESAVEDFNDALLYLRGNLLIDYRQLGLDYKLYSCEVLYNRGLCYLFMGDEDAGSADLYAAQNEKQMPDHEVIEQAIAEGIDGLSVFSLPPGLLFRPPESKIKNAKKVDYLGSSKLIAAVERNDMFTGFKGAYVRKMSAPTVETEGSMPASMFAKSAAGAGASSYMNNQFARQRSASDAYQSAPSGPRGGLPEEFNEPPSLQRRPTQTGPPAMGPAGGRSGGPPPRMAGARMSRPGMGPGAPRFNRGAAAGGGGEYGGRGGFGREM